jgi:hypothetical protein
MFYGRTERAHGAVDNVTIAIAICQVLRCYPDFGMIVLSRHGFQNSWIRRQGGTQHKQIQAILSSVSLNATHSHMRYVA